MSRLLSIGIGAIATVMVNAALGMAIVEAAAIPHIDTGRINCFCVFIMAPPPTLPEIRDWNSLAITLTRGACFGTCPIYSVTIHGDGRVAFLGGQYTGQPGPHTARIPATAIRALFEKFRAANFFALKDEYRGEVTDNPTYTVTLRFDDHTKVVVDYVGRMAGMPLVVPELENAIDETANTAQWIAKPGAQQ